MNINVETIVKDNVVLQLLINVPNLYAPVLYSCNSSPYFT